MHHCSDIAIPSLQCLPPTSLLVLRAYLSYNEAKLAPLDLALGLLGR